VSRNELRVSGKGLENLAKLARELGARPEARIGIFSGSTDSRDDGAGLGNVQIGIIHEFNERSFLRATANAKKAEWLKLLERVLTGALQGKVEIIRGLELVAQKAASDVRRYIMVGQNLKPLHPRTIKAKGSSRPLVDTGQLVKSIGYQIAGITRAGNLTVPGAKPKKVAPRGGLKAFAKSADRARMRSLTRRRR
jgi:hypothetical protein